MEASLRAQLTHTGLPYVLIHDRSIDLCAREVAELQLEFSPSVWQSDLFLVVDIYSVANPVHPDGHVGWWKWTLDKKGPLGVQIRRTGAGYAIEFEGLDTPEKWVNPDYTGLAEETLAVHFVLRDAASHAIRFEDTLHLYTAAERIENAQRRRAEIEKPWVQPPSSPWYLWPREATVHLVATNISERDAVSNFALATARLLRSNGVSCRLYADRFDPALRGAIQHTSHLFESVGSDDLVLVNFSIVDPWLPDIARLSSRKVLYFHNITPPRFFQVYDAEYAAHCSRGAEQIAHAQAFDVVLANSAASARVLERFEIAQTGQHNHALNGHSVASATDSGLADRGQSVNGHTDNERHSGNGSKGPFEDASRLLERASRMLDEKPSPRRKVHICPPLIEFSDSRAEPTDLVRLPRKKTLLLYVGRVAPHKRIEDLFALFAHYHRINRDSALLVVGTSSFSGYTGYLHHLLDTAHAKIRKHIHFYEGLSDGALASVYQSATAMVMMSEHEGFCLPVYEAMRSDKPVFAYADEAVAETLGRSGRIFYEKDFAAMARDIADVLSTPWRKEQLLSAQRRRVEEIQEQTDGHAIWAALEQGMFIRASAV